MKLKRPNWLHVRHRIDTGKTGDKVNFPDPAAAPLGTDEEAGGATTPPEAIARELEEGGPAFRDRRPGEASAPPRRHR